MYSVQILKAALHKEIIDSFGVGPVQYLPLGVTGGAQVPFTLSDEHPKGQTDLTANQARLVIDEPASGAHPDCRNYGQAPLQLSAYALAKPDAGFLIDYMATFLGCIGAKDMPMVGQLVNRAQVTRRSGPKLITKLQLNAASLDVVFHLTLDK